MRLEVQLSAHMLPRHVLLPCVDSLRNLVRPVFAHPYCHGRFEVRPNCCESALTILCHYSADICFT